MLDSCDSHILELQQHAAKRDIEKGQKHLSSILASSEERLRMAAVPEPIGLRRGGHLNEYLNPPRPKSSGPSREPSVPTFRHKIDNNDESNSEKYHP